MSEALRHLGIEAHFGGPAGGGQAAAGGVLPAAPGTGVAGRRGQQPDRTGLHRRQPEPAADAEALLTEAAALAGASGAERVLSSVQEAQAELGLRA